MWFSSLTTETSLVLLPALFGALGVVAWPLDEAPLAKRATVHKRGVAYNNAGNVSLFQVSGSKVSWSYNWSPVKGSGYTASYAFVPMLWGPGDDDIWSSDLAANKLKANAPLFFFNEPDGCADGQSCVTDPKKAASEFKAHMQPWAGKYQLGSPCVTNSNAAGQGLDYITQFMTACSGCEVDFVCMHWYNSNPSLSTVVTDFKNQVAAAVKQFGKPVWVNEFRADGLSAANEQSFLKQVLPWLDSQSSVTHYAYFFAKAGILVNSAGTGLSALGQIYATY